MKAQIQHTALENTSTECQKLIVAKQYLDQHCPLEFGSHKDVSSYVVYYNHLMVFFADGQHCGLKDCKQFVALCGHRESPSAILLKKADGMHIELSFDTACEPGRHDLAHLNDVQYETPLSPVTGEGEQGSRMWMSFVSGVQHALVTQQDRKCYRAKNGDDYSL
ncbi:malate synthase [Pseudoalteromonas sp. R3]|jgi:malate synthase|uniref:malate synthase n=1 Tax=Pseudoalteromonas sp. R3 TaxID=1709477 RepID=UPI0006B5EFA6|nr:malate synthase [Pseudoalteromonas sp. R3]AZZ95729.1 malate synthase [Pseudoalteromonas sp. R3]